MVMSTQNWLILAKFAKRRLSNHNDIWKQKILKLFCKQANKSQDLTMQLLKTLQCDYWN